MRNFLKACFYSLYYPAAFVWRKLDRINSWPETKWWIDHLPNGMFTSATYASYAGWMQNQGIFSALFSVYLEKPNPNIFDFGCGMGGVAPVASYFVRNGGKYVGSDTDAKSIAACHATYGDLKNCEFHLTRDMNPWYPQEAGRTTASAEIDWPVTSNSQDLVVAMSVFTHLQEAEAVRYMNKIVDVLVPGGLAILSFAIMRDYHNPHWCYQFNHALSPGWFTSNPHCPEMSIALRHEALLRLLGNRFTILKHIEGQVSGGRHPSLQDLFIMRKNTAKPA